MPRSPNSDLRLEQGQKKIINNSLFYALLGFLKDQHFGRGKNIGPLFHLTEVYVLGEQERERETSDLVEVSYYLVKCKAWTRSLRGPQICTRTTWVSTMLNMQISCHTHRNLASRGLGWGQKLAPDKCPGDSDSPKLLI